MEPNPARIPMDPELYSAASTGDIDTLEQLLMPNILHSRLLGVTHAGDTALHVAARFGDRAVAESICTVKLSLVMRDNDKLETPLHYAAKAGKHEVVAVFIRHATAHNINLELLRKRNKDGETALYQSVLYNHAEVVRMLVRADGNQNISPLASISDDKNISPLYLAAMQGQFDTVTSLIGSLEGNVSQEAYAGPDGQTVLHAAAAAAQTTEDDFRRILIWRPELAKSTDKSGSTPLHYAVSCDNLEVVRVILETNRTCAYTADSSGLFPVHIAVTMGFVEVVEELFERCRDSDQLLDKKGRNFVHLAVEERKERMVRWICRRSELAEAMNAQDYNGDTAMHLAVKVSDINIFARLLETKRANLCVMNKEGLTPRGLAMSKVTVGFSYTQNPDSKICQILHLIKNSHGINRGDHFELERNLQREKIKEKEEESLENMAKSRAIGSVLIASAAFTAAFSITGAHKADFLAGNKSSGLNVAFKSFIVMVAYAIFCSITATALLVESALTFLDPMTRRSYIIISSFLVSKATRGFVIAFAIGVYVVLTPLCKWLALVVCLAGAVVVVFMEPYYFPNPFVIRALIRYLGWISFFWELDCLGSNIVFVIFVLLTLLGSLAPTRFDFIVWCQGFLITVHLGLSFPLGNFLGKLRSTFWSLVLPRRR